MWFIFYFWFMSGGNDNTTAVNNNKFETQVSLGTIAVR